MAALGTITSAFVGWGATPAFASSCSYSLPWTLTSTQATVKVYCNKGGTPSLVAEAYVTLSGSSTYVIEVEDWECDNIGPYWHAHEPGSSGIYNLGAHGCDGPNGHYEIGKTSIGSPKNWWLEFNGKNSAAVAYPTTKS